MATTSANATVHSGVNPGWWVPPQGLPLVVPVGQPAIGAEWSWQAPRDRLVKVKSVRLKLVCAATVANRVIGVQFADQNGTILATSAGSDNLVANTTTMMGWWANAQFSTATATTWTTPMPELLLPYGGQVKSLASGLQATDQLSTIVLLVELY